MHASELNPPAAPEDPRAARLDECLAISALCWELALAGQRRREEDARRVDGGPAGSPMKP